MAAQSIASPYRVILTARPSSLLRFKSAGISESDRLWIRPLDVTNDAQRRAVVREADVRWGGVDVLVNNAGLAYRAVVEHFTEADDIRELNVNFIAPMALIQLVLPLMRARRRGRIINVSSVGGMMAMPTMALYSASKFALEGACESLWYEVRPWGIHVRLVEPGFIHSDSFQRTRYTPYTPASERGSSDAADPYHSHYQHMGEFIARLMTTTGGDTGKGGKEDSFRDHASKSSSARAGNNRCPLLLRAATAIASETLPLDSLSIAAGHSGMGQSLIQSRLIIWIFGSGRGP